MKYVPDDCGVGGHSNYHKVTNPHAGAGALETKSQCFKSSPLQTHPGKIVIFNFWSLKPSKQWA